MYNTDSSPTLTDITFSRNVAVDGGGMYNLNSYPTLTNVTFSRNVAFDGGGMYNETLSSPLLTNVTFYGNSAEYGGGMYNDITFSATFGLGPAIRNTIFWGNTANTAGTQIYNKSFGTRTLSDSVIQGGCPAGTPCTNLITTNPILGLLGNYGGFTQTIPIKVGSSAINTGNDSICPATDQRGVTRPQSTHCDIGAYEMDDFTAPTVVSSLRVNANPSNLTSVDFTVTFSESVTGVDITDFSLMTNGISGASVTGVSGSGSVYTITVNTGSGSGAIRLDLPASAAITDLAGKPACQPAYTGSETYTSIRIQYLFLPLILR